MRNFIILIVVLFTLTGSCGPNSSPPPKDPEFVKRINLVNELLDAMEMDSRKVIGWPTATANHPGMMKDIIAGRVAKFLIENPDIALPEMFKRLDSKKLSHIVLIVYYIVFEKTKSAESIPYLADYFTSVTKEEIECYDGTMADLFAYALQAAQHITSLKLVDENRTLFDQRNDIANKLNQWYEDYKKTNAKKEK